jgi:HupE / UreJ protein
MKTRLLAAAVVLLAAAGFVFAHRLDEYLQATIFSLEKDRVVGFMRLVPGVAVSSVVIASIDTNADGVLSGSEQRAYAERVLGEVSLTVDGNRLRPRLVSLEFPNVEEMREGLGQIQIEFAADLPRGGPNRRLVFENHYQNRIAAYLVNCLVPSDLNIRVVEQKRNEDQSFYQLDYVQPGANSEAASLPWWRSLLGWKGAVSSSMFRLGMRHIAEGTDHLLFLLALLLPAPLLVIGSRWAGFAGARHSALQILKVVTAFTVGHSITLALAALGPFRVPSRPIEVLIALSILVSAAHALRPLFPGREAGIAAFFGLIHGFAFAATIGDLGLGWWERVGSILEFNLGIETMQLIVVAAIMPSLVLMSRTRAYPLLRVGGALLASFASLGWITDRLFSLHNPAGAIVSSVARHGVQIAVVLFVTSLVWELLPNVPARNRTFRLPLPVKSPYEQAAPSSNQSLSEMRPTTVGLEARR